MKRSYYCEVDTYWEHSRSYFVGPFATRHDAEAWFDTDTWQPDDNVWRSDSGCGGDIRVAWRVYTTVWTKTEARARGLRSFSQGDQRDNELPPHTRPTAVALDAAVRDLHESQY